MRTPAPIVPSTGPMPEVAPFAPPATPGTPPVEQIIATQTQHTAILRQIQQHLGILSPPAILSEPTDPSHGPPLVEQTMPPEETTTEETEASIPSIPTSIAEPSSPHDPPTTI
ncbi:merozoite surface protein CMZ-8-like [Vitis riparia]|uniref:merozoite surface protein CMZ-8-like n=1 Tax=Vitis riparia TaxID=96939 RepID=UPI00155AB0BF|nr:merozoite surface protein CMZ-8-like [Vitis riparia]